MQGRSFPLAALVALSMVMLPLVLAQAACSLSGAAIAFGSYDPTLATPLDSAAAVISMQPERSQHHDYA
jgi:hypothetical protein